MEEASKMESFAKDQQQEQDQVAIENAEQAVADEVDAVMLENNEQAVLTESKEQKSEQVNENGVLKTASPSPEDGLAKQQLNQSNGVTNGAGVFGDESSSTNPSTSVLVKQNGTMVFKKQPSGVGQADVNVLGVEDYSAVDKVKESDDIMQTDNGNGYSLRH